MKNHENWPTEITIFPKVNEVYVHYARCGKVCGPECGCDDQERNPTPGNNHSPNKRHCRKEKEKHKKYGSIACFCCG